ncbi:hypothetical protein [Phorcysia thermohydrogeniphila]|uniref:Uncharacterized protein n=1 Tax=Phorcysia thermohydrogeniphila TaxID=936138 RepID=A0A4V2PDR5_9BACT|nr:hypothetical protein [Phorcysia thermohydrogeniphila]TCK06216.1 hypothetical protein CLV27_0017 [Phorcysia thermohydrogeniphila]
MSLVEKLCKEKEIAELCREIARALSKNFKTVVETTEELESEVALVLLERKEKLCKELERISFAYLLLTVKNALIDKFFRSKNTLTVLFSESSEESNFLSTLKAENFSPVSLLNVKEAIKKLKEVLSKGELETLCYYFHSVLYRKDENPFLSEKSQDAKYKAWSRLKPKVRELLKDYDLTEEEIRLLGELLLSEFLKKNRFNLGRTKGGT